MTGRLGSPDTIVAVVTAMIGLGTLAVVPSEIRGESLAAIGDMNSPAFFPLLAAAALILCAVALGVRTATAAEVTPPVTVERPGMVLTMAALFGLFAAGTFWIGLIPAAGLAILAMGLLLGYRKPWLLLVAVAVPAAVYILFERMLLILLPRGSLFS